MGKASRRKKVRRKQDLIGPNITRRQFIIWGIGGTIALTGIGAACKFLYDLLKQVDFETACQTGRWQEYFDSNLRDKHFLEDTRLEYADKIYWDPNGSILRQICQEAMNIYSKDKERREHYDVQKNIRHDAVAKTFSSPYKEGRYLIFVFPKILDVTETEDDIKSYLDHEGQHARFMATLAIDSDNLNKEEIIRGVHQKDQSGTDYLTVIGECDAYHYQLTRILDGTRPSISPSTVERTFKGYSHFYEKLAGYAFSIEPHWMRELATRDLHKFVPPEALKTNLLKYLR